MFTFKIKDESHELHTVEQARMVHDLLAGDPDADVHPCTWLVERTHVFDGGEEWGVEYDDRIEDCGALAVFHRDGFNCVAGHEHTNDEARQRQNWEYAADAYDAAVIMAGGRAFRPMSATAEPIDEREIVQVARALGI